MESMERLIDGEPEVECAARPARVLRGAQSNREERDQWPMAPPTAATGTLPGRACSTSSQQENVSCAAVIAAVTSTRCSTDSANSGVSTSKRRARKRTRRVCFKLITVL